MIEDHHRKTTAVSTHTIDDYMLIFNDESTKRITKGQADQVIATSGGLSRFLILDGVMINFSNIARLLPIREYYEQFPDERPEVARDYTNYREEYVGFQRTYLTKEALIKKYLMIWKRQRDSIGFERVTGGLDGLILWAEKKLKDFETQKHKKLTISVEISLSKTPEKPLSYVDKRKRLEAIRAKRGSIGELLTS
jgi:hypothetical protein